MYFGQALLNQLIDDDDDPHDESAFTRNNVKEHITTL